MTPYAKEWEKMAKDYDHLADEYYDVWIDALFADAKNEAECYYDHYLEQIRSARHARKHACAPL